MFNREEELQGDDSSCMGQCYECKKEQVEVSPDEIDTLFCGPCWEKWEQSLKLRNNHGGVEYWKAHNFKIRDDSHAPRILRFMGETPPCWNGCLRKKKIKKEAVR